MKAKTNLKAGGITLNHDQTLTRPQAQGFKVKTQVKAGGVSLKHNQTLVQNRKR